MDTTLCVVPNTYSSFNLGLFLFGMQSPASKYLARYSQGVILRDNSLREYNAFLRNLDENTPLEKLAAQYIQKYGKCRVLDVGCGNGQALHELKQHVGSLVHTLGIDLLPLSNPRMLDEFVEGDVHEVPIPQNCHIILSFRALHEMGSLDALLPKLASALAPGGRAYLWVRMREWIENRIHLVGEMSEQEEKSLLQMGQQKDLHGAKILVEPFEQTIGDESRHVSFVAGYAVLLFRSS